jgi:branched-chain amino acid transport system permease protein
VNGNFATLLFGAGLIHALMTAPNGISGQLHDAIAWLCERHGRTAPR